MDDLAGVLDPRRVAVYALADDAPGGGGAGSGDDASGSGRDDAGEGGNADPGTDDPDVDWKAEAERWKQRSRRFERDAKQGADAARRLREMEDADKTELERASERARELESKATDAEQRALRAEIALEKGLSRVQAKRLVGTTREELEADADELVAEFGKGAGGGANPPAGKPREALRSGAAGEGSGEPEETDPRKLADQIPRA